MPQSSGLERNAAKGSFSIFSAPLAIRLSLRSAQRLQNQRNQRAKRWSLLPLSRPLCTPLAPLEDGAEWGQLSPSLFIPRKDEAERSQLSPSFSTPVTPPEDGGDRGPFLPCRYVAASGQKRGSSSGQNSVHSMGQNSRHSIGQNSAYSAGLTSVHCTGQNGGRSIRQNSGHSI